MAEYIVEVRADDTREAVLMTEYNGHRIMRKTVVKDPNTEKGLRTETEEWR